MGVAFAGAGAWAGYKLGGSAATAGIGAPVGAIAGAFAPSVTEWLVARARSRNSAAQAHDLPRDVSQPSRLLDPYRKIAEFAGRDRELAELTAWCETGNAPRLRLVTGAGGTGKTRLALRFADYAQELGWRCHWVGDGQEEDALTRIRAVTSGRVLLIVDYAETRTGLPDLLRAAATDHGAALRILFLARSAGPWWEQIGVSEPAIRDLVTAAGREGHILDRGVGGVDDAELVRQALIAFASELKVELPSDLSVVVMPGNAQARVLDLHAGALVTLLNSASQPVGSPVRMDLSDVISELLRHEERFWLGTAHASSLMDGPAGITLTGIRRIVAASCLLGAISEQEALSLLARVPDITRSTRLAEWLQALYPPEAGSGEWLGTLRPDRIAEYHAVTQLADSGTFARRCFTELNERQTIRALILLVRAAADHASAAKLLDQLLALVPPELGGVREALISIANVIAPNVKLAAAYTTIIRRILDTMPAGADIAERGSWLIYYGNALAQLRQAGGAFAATRDAVAIFRELAADDPDRYRPELANALHDLAVRLSELDRDADALGAAQAAVTIRRALTAADPSRHLLDLAHSQTSLGARLFDLSRSAEAVIVIEEAVSSFRELATDEPDRNLFRLAHSLDHLGAAYSAVDRPSDALAVAQEAVLAYRALAIADPGSYRAGLARSLDHLGARLNALHREADALAPFEEAAAIRRDLATTVPDSYRPRLARSLDNLGLTLLALGRPAEALTPFEEAASIRQNLAAADPGQFGADLDRSVSNLVRALDDLATHVSDDQLDDVLSAYDQALAIAPDYASLHFNKAVLLFGAGRFSEAEPELRETIRLRPSDVLGALVLRAAMAWPTDQHEARKQFTKALSSPGDLLSPFTRALYRAIALAGIGRAEDAQQELRAALPAQSPDEKNLDEATTRLLKQLHDPPLPGLNSLRQLIAG
jgi:tetratricopeptide (TPR) repeat protein